MILMLIMNTHILFPTRLHQLREERSLYQKQVAEALSIDTPMYCRIEKGERKAKREQVIMLADALNADREELLALWLADQVTTVLSSEKPIANKALSIVSKHISEIR